MPLVSVIIPNYNHARYLTQRIESVLNQTYKSMEVIILDDCSTDNSREIIEQYRTHPKVAKIIYNEKNSGSTFAQWNRGVAEAVGEYIWIAESDDIARSTELLTTLVHILEANAQLGLAYCQSIRIDKDGKEHGIFLHYTSQFQPNIWENDFQMQGTEFIDKYLFFMNVIPNASAVIFRKSVFEASGCAETNFRLLGDWLVWLSMLSISNVAFVAKPHNSFRFHANNVSSNVSEQKWLKESMQMMKSIQQTVKPIPAKFDIALDCFLERFYLEFLRNRDTKFFQEIYAMVENITENNKTTKQLFKNQTTKATYIDACLVHLQTNNWYVGAKGLLWTGIVTKNLWYYLKSIVYWTVKRIGF